MGKCCCLLFILIAALVILGVSIGVPLALKKAKDAANEGNQSAVNAACQVTSYPAACAQTLGGSNGTADSTGITKVALNSASSGVNNTLAYVLSMNATDSNITNAVDVCIEVLGLSIEHIEAALAELDAPSSNATEQQDAMADIQAWVSAAMEFHTTCVDVMTEVNATAGQTLSAQANYTDQLLSNSLAFINAFAAYGDNVLGWKATSFSLPSDLDLSSFLPGGSRKLLSSEPQPQGQPNWMKTASDGMPSWMDGQMRRHLLQEGPCGCTVAQNGGGNYRTIMGCVNAHANNVDRFTICVKAGTYYEQVIIPKSAKSLTIVGDGVYTVITGNRNVALQKGMTTYLSATLIVQGAGFIGKSFTVQNTAGSNGHQACAFRGSADQIAFYQVTFDAWQDTMYTHVLRHFYSECTIRGTVDFLFGNAAAAFQSCTIVAKKTTLEGQQNTYTAQGRTDPHQATGLAFQSCTFTGTPDLMNANQQYYPTYLGRPWKAYSVSVIMESELMGNVNPAGWLYWLPDNSFGLYTSFFAEYRNWGPGSNTYHRVNWSHQISKPNVANYYQADSFVQANRWVSGMPLKTTL